ncbi:UpxY family transcription antiterminator [bacterium]|nr:UpxY family transcription antiterminator [bacterium]
MNNGAAVLCEEPEQSVHWYALYTKPRHEKKVEKELVKKQIGCYLPMRKTLRQWSDRRKWVEEPLFRSYIFIQGDNALRYRAVQTPGVVRAVMFQGRLAVVRDEEIDWIRRILCETDDVEAVPQLLIGEEVEVRSGPLIGLRGRLTQFQGEQRLVIDVPSIRQAVRISVDVRDIQKVN